MADTIKVPGVGPINKKYALIGAAGIAGFIGFAYYRSRQAGDSTTTDPTADTADTAQAFDPSLDATSLDSGGFMGSAPSFFPPFGSSTPVDTGHPTSDAEWNQAAYQVLTDRGIDGAAASHALSRYQANLCLTDAEADFVRQAVGAIGDTPQAHHNIQICQPSGGGTPTPTPTKLTAVSGLHVTKTTTTSVSLAWSAKTGAMGYHIQITGGNLNHTIITHSSTYTFGALKRHTTYHFKIAAYNAVGTGTYSGTVSGKTK